MSSNTLLDPPIATVQSLKANITSALQAVALPATMRADAIAPLLASINKWATQIPLMLDTPSSPASANLVFAIRKELFVAPAFTQSVFGLPPTALPPPFQEFLSFILCLIEAQKPPKDKAVARVRFSQLLYFPSTTHCFLYSLNGPVELSLNPL